MKTCDRLLARLLASSDCQGHSRRVYFSYIPTCLHRTAVGAVMSEMQTTSWVLEQNEGCQSFAVLDDDEERQMLTHRTK